VVATQQVVDHIKATKDAKLAFWGPQMKDGAPTRWWCRRLSPRQPLWLTAKKSISNSLTAMPHMWIPSAKTILGGTGVSWGIHVWTADTQSKESRQQWQQTLDSMAAHKPERVIPGHYLGTPPAGSEAITFTRQYLAQFEQALAKHKDSAGVINAMKTQWPNLAEASSLELSAKVNTWRNEVVM
jgi:hypothetical protein